MRPLLLACVVLVLAGCGGRHVAAPNLPPPPPLRERCGGDASEDGNSLWFRASDGTLLDGVELGEGDRGVVLLHESPADLCGWAPYGARLAKQGFHVLLVDLRAFGLSHRGPYGGKAGAVADVRGAVDELNDLGAKHVAVVGASYGGVTALVAAPALGSSIAAVASLSGELVLGNAGLNALAAMHAIHVPLLIMGSRADPYLDERDARKLVRAATSTNPQLVEFDGQSHGWNLLADSGTSARANRVLVGFLRRVTE